MISLCLCSNAVRWVDPVRGDAMMTKAMDVPRTVQFSLERQPTGCQPDTGWLRGQDLNLGPSGYENGNSVMQTDCFRTKTRAFSGRLPKMCQICAKRSKRQTGHQALRCSHSSDSRRLE